MKPIRLLLFITLLLTFLSVIADPSPKEKKVAKFFISHFENVLGTSMEIKIQTFTENQQSIVEKAVIKEITRLSKILSIYDATSEFSKWMNTYQRAVPVSKELYDVLDLIASRFCSLLKLHSSFLQLKVILVAMQHFAKVW